MIDSTTKHGCKLSIKTISCLLLVFIFVVALALRVSFAYQSVFPGGWVRFREIDPWYHMRLVENLVRHFPLRISFDPYTLYPSGQAVFFAPFFDILLGFFIWVIGLGNPTQQVIETVGAFFPAVLGALVVIPVYFIGKELFNRGAGLIAAALIAIFPGTFLARSMLGFTDHHVAEVLFSSLTILFLTLALKSARENKPTFDHVRERTRRIIRKPLTYALLAGIALGTYLLSWAGGLLLVFIIYLGFVILYIMEHLRDKSTDYLCIIGLPVFLTPLIMIVPFLGQLSFGNLCLISLAIGVLTFPVLSYVSRLMKNREIGRACFPLVLLGCGCAGMTGLFIVSPSLFRAMLTSFNIFIPNTTALTVFEARPLFTARGPFSFAPVWDEFTTSSFTAPVALLLVTFTAIRKASAEKIMFLLWCLIILAATLSQIRFTYYLAVNVALLSGYLYWKAGNLIPKAIGLLNLDGSTGSNRTRSDIRRKKRKEKSRKGRDAAGSGEERSQQQKRTIPRYLRPKYIAAVMAAAMVFFAVLYPNIKPALKLARAASGVSKDWYDALVWMRENTPEPFQNPDFYYELYRRPDGQEKYDYPESAYSVMAWWDYGHWITQMAHRIPVSNPHQAGVKDSAAFFIAQDEASANKILDRLDSRYVVIDLELASPYRLVDSKSGQISKGKFYAMPVWSGEEISRYFEIYYRENEGSMEPLPLYYPEYYRSMCARLYNFKGQQVEPSNTTMVISFAENSGYKEVLTTQVFHTYDDAKAYVEKQTSPNYRIVGNDPFISPVPLEKLEHYRLVHQSDSWGAKQGEKIISYLVEIFEYSPETD
ncbi:MAG: oligosaccharyl transferase, archaeosortase A system-associated [Chloroflexota bacterium]